MAVQQLVQWGPSSAPTCRRWGRAFVWSRSRDREGWCSASSRTPISGRLRRQSGATEAGPGR
jgi:hypothetical protein